MLRRLASVVVIASCALAACRGGGGGASDAAADSPGVAPDLGVGRAAPIIDGLFDDWRDVPVAARDPAGDGDSAGFDVRALSLQSRGAVLYVLVELERELNFHEGPPEAISLRIDVALPGGHTLRVDSRARAAFYDTGPISWERVRYRLAPSYASTRFEMRLDLAPLGVLPGSEVTVTLSGADKLDAALRYRLGEGVAPAPARRSPARTPQVGLRVASLNTLQTGLFDAVRGPRLERLLGAVQADVYCLQEVYDTPASRVAELLARARGGRWNVHVVRDSFIASRAPLLPLPSQNQRYAAALVIADAGVFAVVSAHLSCCGFIGDVQDQKREAEVDGIVETLRALREKRLGPALASYAEARPIVVGDYNLVGSREPLTRLERAGLERFALEHLVGREAHTWIKTSSPYPAAILDHLVHDPRLARVGGYVLDTRELVDSELSALGVERDDSDGSDHLLLVADFARVLP
ncbi:MAG: endonuclease/exonuclease/phosphatase family protein [Myxococcales bacterium]|nr:endonuclease/exonuclease/phosphatase family protein [Myxococcales bacterium]